MSIIGRFLYVLLLFVSLVVRTNDVLAGIKDSPHDIISWQDKGGATGVAGTCAYCHVPHSSKGDRLFPEAAGTDSTYGTLGAICSKCHNTTLYGEDAKVADQIFLTLDKVTVTKSDSTMDSHPTVKTGFSGQPKTLQDTDLSNVKDAKGDNWPWIVGWVAGAKVAGAKDIECTTCHNPHNWNTEAYGSTAQRKFLRAPIYDSAASAGKRNFCSNCHKNRESSDRNNALGTHPVSSGLGGVKLETGLGLYKDVVYLFQSFSEKDDIKAGVTERSGKAIWDKVGKGKFLGARLYNGGANDQVICQSCHMPHGVMHQGDDVYNDGATKLSVGPLLAISNVANLYDTAKYPAGAPDLQDYPIEAESVYCLPAGHQQSLLCEWCHGMTPDLHVASEGKDVYSHPVNLYPTSTNDDIPLETTDYGMVIRTKYPPDTWKKYRESKGIRSVYDIGEDFAAGLLRKGKDRYIVCLSCHEPHQADTTNGYILKKGTGGGGATAADGAFCSGCHNDVAMGTGVVTDEYFTTWTTHPSGSNAKLLTKDSREDGKTVKLPNRAGLRVFGVDPDEYVSCWTCHGAHEGKEKPLLTDYQKPFSQICVNCHCEGGLVVDAATSLAAKWKYGNGTGAETNANPSKYYKEGAGTWWSNYAGKRSGSPSEFKVGDEMRLGSHFIGKFAAKETEARPKVDDTTALGWLGERESVRTAGTLLKMTELYHRQDYALTAITGDEKKDRWLDTSSYMLVDTAWKGSNQKSHLGSLDGGTNNVIICQTCHAVHNTATGVAGQKTVSRLLLASNYDSYMCKRCHIPNADSTKSHPMSCDTSGALYNHNGSTFVYDTIVGRTGALVNMTDDKFAYITVYAPADYPDSRMNCDACHTPHNADSKMGAMILEGNNLETTTGTGKIASPYFNKVPTMLERNDEPTCRLCHKQATASE